MVRGWSGGGPGVVLVWTQGESRGGPGGSRGSREVQRDYLLNYTV